MPNLSQITADALELPLTERAQLAQRLWSSIAPLDSQHDSQSDSDRDLRNELERRDREMDADPSKTISHENVMEFVKRNLLSDDTHAS
jgi:putative addiction module component (TIGR02574 family)